MHGLPHRRPFFSKQTAAAARYIHKLFNERDVTMLHDIIFLILGLALLIFGGNLVTDGAVAVAKKMNISGLVIGLTIVAFGSSAPDLAVCLFSTMGGKSQMALGDVVGAGIFDMLCAVGLTAIVRPVVVDRNSLKCSLPLLFLAALVIFFFGDDRLIDGAALDRIDRSDGLVMLCFFAIFMAFTLQSARVQAPASPAPAAAPQKPAMTMKPWLAAIYIVAGLGALVLGGQWIVDGASGIALKAGMSEALVGLTIVAVGSSLPDAATSVIAAIKGQTGLAMGNLIGSCIFDILFVIGTCASLRPLNCGQISFFDYGVLVGASLLLLLFSTFRRSHTIPRWMGFILVGLYAAYIVAIAS